MMLKRKLAAGLAIAMLSGMVSGSMGTVFAEEEPVTIKFVGYANSVAGFEARAQEFMAQHPDIIVEVQGIPANSWGELMQAISVNIAGGDIPDIADIASEGQRAFAASGLIAPIDEYLERDREELQETLDGIDPALMETMKYNGETYCLPTVWNNMLLYYNKIIIRTCWSVLESKNRKQGGPLMILLRSARKLPPKTTGRTIRTAMHLETVILQPWCHGFLRPAEMC